jgi:hypothetical protein
MTMRNAQRFDFAGITTTGVPQTANGASKIALAGGARSFGLEVKGVGAAPTSWSVNLEGSLDGVNWTALLTHNAGDGSTQWAVDKPVSQVRVNVTALTLGGASAINVNVLASP